MESVASPGGAIDLEDKPSRAENPESTINEIFEQRLLAPDQSPLKKQHHFAKKFYYPYKKSLSVVAGLLLDIDRIKEDSETPLILGLAHMFESRKSPRWEAQLNFLSDSTAQIGVAQRYNFNEPHHFRGFLKYGLVLQINPDEKFATITNIDNYSAALSVGMEDVLRLPKSVRLELQALFGTETQAFIFYVGSSWGLSSDSG